MRSVTTAVDTRRGPDWETFENGPLWCVICKRDLPPLPPRTVYVTNPTCSAECERELRRSWRLHWAGPVTCAECGGEFAPLRRDARYCSDVCRQRHHRGGRSA